MDAEHAAVAFLDQSFERVSTSLDEQVWPAIVLASTVLAQEQGTEDGAVIAQTVRLQVSVYGATKEEASDTARAINDLLSIVRGVDVADADTRIRSVDAGPVRWLPGSTLEPAQPRYGSDYTLYVAPIPNN